MTNLLNLDGGGRNIKSISVCVSSLQRFTEAASSTRCRAVWPIRETRGECGCVVCMCLFVRSSVISGRLGRSVNFLSALFHLLVHTHRSSPLLVFVSSFIPPSFLSLLEFRVRPSGTSSPAFSPSVPSRPRHGGEGQHQ